MNQTDAKSSAGPVVRFREVSKIIGGKTLVDNLTLDVQPGEVFGFLGPNGAGKTTTIRMLVGLISMSTGDIQICGKSITTDFENAIESVGAIVENPELYSYMSGYGNLMQYARMRSNVSKERIDEVVAFVGLTERIQDKVRTYSLGMRQRLGVAQAILHRPKLLILDEPTNGLDPQGIRELRDYLRALAHKEGTAVFVSSHLLTEMELMCDRVAIIQNGKLIEVQKVQGDTGEGTEKTEVEVEFEVGDAAIAVQKLGAGEAKGGHLVIRIEHSDIAKINARLVEAGIPVSGIRVLKRSLEDQFLEVTGGVKS
ncbi:ABC transporter ATP-binding protein [Saccharibacillus sacchari]|uniref:ABC transporter ATP-binding protein n=1 Tax=Saccharibacillus sacchari TaxID=456493 RepID=UPI0004B44564|nr:ABC transporter ATP-binding protein [Saccharibacillus sacchari]